MYLGYRINVVIPPSTSLLSQRWVIQSSCVIHVVYYKYSHKLSYKLLQKVWQTIYWQNSYITWNCLSNCHRFDRCPQSFDHTCGSLSFSDTAYTLCEYTQWLFVIFASKDEIPQATSHVRSTDYIPVGWVLGRVWSTPCMAVGVATLALWYQSNSENFRNI